MRKLLISSLGAVGMLAISIIAFASTIDNEPIENSDNEEYMQIAVSSAGVVVTEEPAVTMKQTAFEQTRQPAEQPSVSKIHSKDWDSDESYLLAKIAMAEAEDQDTEGKALVILVVLNRVWDNRFPDSIREVIYQKNQFSPVSNGRFDEVEPDADCWKALEMVQVENWDKSKGALYFESKSESTWHEEHLEYLFKHGDHYFYTEQESEE